MGLFSQSSAASRRVVGTCAYSAVYALPAHGSGSSSFWSSAAGRPAATSLATARCGLTSPPGSRFSKRIERPWPTTRSEQVRLSYPQATAVGAKEPGWKRL